MSEVVLSLYIPDPSRSPVPDRGGRVQFITQSGSRYEIDYGAKRWARLEHSEESNDVRTAEGEITGITDIVVGRSLLIFGPPIDSTQDFRMIETTPVMQIVLDEA